MTIAAVILARNEAGRIEHALDTVLQVCDQAIVVDTGSEDNTRELATANGAVVLERPWEGFARSRTAALHAAREHGDYLLMLDADMTIHVNADPPDLTADAYLLPIVDGTLTWRLPLLTRAKHPFEYRGAAHAYLASDAPTRIEPSDWLSIDGGKGASREKLERDLDLLHAAFLEDTSDARTVFYLARTHDDLDQPDQAIAWYRLRAAMGGWNEELYYARYRLGCLLSQHVSFAQGARELLAAWNDLPHRAEALRALANAANAVADKTPLPADGLFLHPTAYRKEEAA